MRTDFLMGYFPLFQKADQKGAGNIEDICCLLCRQLGMEPQNLDLVVPHQANQRIINALRQRMKLAEDQVYSNIGHSGNTSSSTIPLCLEELLPLATAGQKWGLTAFGGGFTFGGAVLEVV